MTKEEYEIAKERLAKGRLKINEVKGWFDPKYEHWVREYDRLAKLVYDFENQPKTLSI